MKDTVVSVYAEGLNQATLLTNLQQDGIAVFDFLRSDARHSVFSVYKKDLRKTFAILDKMCYTYTVGHAHGVLPFLKRLLGRMGIIAGIIVFSVAVALSQNYVWRIEIVGNDAVPEKTIEKALAENNVAVGKKLSGFDSSVVAAAIRAIDGIGLASCEKRGTTVCVKVFESERIAAALPYSDTDIVSGYDATVTRIVTREGTALVSVGQNVFRGTPLIGAYRVAEEGAEPSSSRASGIVYGKVAYTESVVVATEWYEWEPEKTTKHTRLHLFGLTIGKKLPSSPGIVVSESNSKCNVFLPIRVSHARITQTTLKKKTASVEELAAKAENEALLAFIRAEAPSGFTSFHTVRELGGGQYEVHIFIEAEVVIGGA